MCAPFISLSRLTPVWFLPGYFSRLLLERERERIGRENQKWLCVMHSLLLEQSGFSWECSGGDFFSKGFFCRGEFQSHSLLVRPNDKRNIFFRGLQAVERRLENPFEENASLSPVATLFSLVVWPRVEDDKATINVPPVFLTALWMCQKKKK